MALQALLVACAGASLAMNRLVRRDRDTATRAAQATTVLSRAETAAAAAAAGPGSRGGFRYDRMLGPYLLSVVLATAVLQAAFLHLRQGVPAGPAMAFVAGCLLGEWLLPADRAAPVLAVGLAAAAIAACLHLLGEHARVLEAALRSGKGAGSRIASLSVSPALVTGLVAIHEVRALLSQRRGMLARLQSQDLTIDVLLNQFGHGGADWLWETDRDARMVAIQRRDDEPDLAEGALLLAYDWAGWLRDGVREGSRSAPEFRRLITSLRERSGWRDIAVPLPLPARGDRPAQDRWISLSARPLFDELHGFRGFRGVASDITVAREDARRERHRSRHDLATGLVNRDAFAELVRARLDRAEGGFHLLALDLHGFRLLNLQHGHETGDRLLRAVARRLSNLVRRGDVVCRIEGDRFAVMVLETDPAHGVACADRVVRQVCEPYRLDSHHFMLRASVGVATAPLHGGTPESLMRAAEVALIWAKTDGPGSIRMFLPTMEEEARDRRAMQIDLAGATARDEFTVAYQPVVDLAQRRIIGAEALLRWDHPVRGAVPPSTFIGVAEESGLIGGIGRFALAEACREVAKWPEHLHVAVNVSALQFRDPNFAAGVAGAMREASIGPNRLELEVTESVMIEAGAQVGGTLAELRAAGVRVALDDFGTGFASLGYLRRFPFDRIKIDRSFVSELTTSEQARAIVRAMIELAHGLGLRTTAEGVETEAQLRMLVELGCTHAQGYYFSRPVGAAALRAGFRSGAGLALPA